MVLHYAPDDFYQASTFRKGSPIPTGNRTISASLVNDDEVEEHNGKMRSIYQLSDEVELDEAFFPIRTTDIKRNEKLKRGVGNQQQAKVLVIVESKPVDRVLQEYLSTAPQSIEKASKLISKTKGKSVGKIAHYIKMFVIDNLSAKTLDEIVRRHIDKDAVVVTDGSMSHTNFKEYFKGHEPHIENDVEEVVKSNFPWVHLVIGMCRDGISAIHGDIDKQFLQLYLNEFCWKFNRRFFRDSTDPKYDLFDRLVKTAACYTSDIKWRNYEQPDDEII